MSSVATWMAPTEEMMPSVIVVRRAVGSGNPQGSPTARYANAVRRASVQEMSVDDQQLHGIAGATMAYDVFLAVDPGVKTDDRIVKLDRLITDPVAPRAGLVWVNTTEGTVKRAVAGGVVTIGPVPGTTDVLTFDAPLPADVTGAAVMSCLARAENVNDRGVFFRVECRGQG